MSSEIGSNGRERGDLMFFSLAFVLSDQASANDGPLCTTSAAFLQSSV
jgi:hypothetical protein